MAVNSRGKMETQVFRPWSLQSQRVECRGPGRHGGFANLLMGFPGGSEVKAPACNAGDLGLIPGSERFPGEGNGNPLQYSCLENPMDRGAWWATVHGVAKESDTTEKLHFHFHFGVARGFITK